MMHRFIVTGTDTGIGKTVFAAALTAHLGARYWKPVQAGLDEESDSDAVARLSGLGKGAVIPEAYRLRTPCSPDQAAQIDGVTIDPGRLSLPDGDDPLVVEGAGGVLVPLSPTLLFADVFARWRLPVILVARTSLGTINHSLLSIEALRSRGVPVHGCAFVGPQNAANESAICGMGAASHLGRMPWLVEMSPPSLLAAFRENIRADLL